MKPVILLEVSTEPNESVTFEVDPQEVLSLADFYVGKGMTVEAHVLSSAEFAARKERLKNDTTFQGEQLPY